MMSKGIHEKDCKKPCLLPCSNTNLDPGFTHSLVLLAISITY